MFIPIVLFFLSYVIYIGVLNKKNMWLWITMYWLAVSMKNMFDYMGVS